MARRPFSGTVNITQEYGTPSSVYRRGYHTGVDYGLPAGHPLVSPTNGTVTSTGYESSKTNGRGNYIVILGDDGISHNIYHMKDMALVRTGRVTEGQAIGFVGSTGASTGNHLHWETRRAPHDGNSDFAPGTWLFAGQPVYTPPAQHTAYVRIFGDYRTLWTTSAGTTKKATLSPAAYSGHLDYIVLERKGDYVRIQTQLFGGGWIFVGATVAHLTQFYNA